MTPRQLAFDLPVRPALGRDDFFVSPTNAHAVAMIEGWQGWPARKLLLTGPKGAGKTHLSHVFAALSGATILPATSLTITNIPDLARAPVVVEDIPTIAGDPDQEAALFHLHNLALAEGQSLLFTAATAPNLWPITLPDLASRMQGTPAVTIAAPDDSLLMAVLMKLFNDRQLSPTPDTIPYLARNMERSFDAAHSVVATLDRAALEKGREINKRLAGDVLRTLARPENPENSGTE